MSLRVIEFKLIVMIKCFKFFLFVFLLLLCFKSEAQLVDKDTKRIILNRVLLESTNRFNCDIIYLNENFIDSSAVTYFINNRKCSERIYKLALEYGIERDELDSILEVYFSLDADTTTMWSYQDILSDSLNNVSIVSNEEYSMLRQKRTNLVIGLNERSKRKLRAAREKHRERYRGVCYKELYIILLKKNLVLVIIYGWSGFSMKIVELGCDEFLEKSVCGWAH